MKIGESAEFLNRSPGLDVSPRGNPYRRSVSESRRRRWLGPAVALLALHIVLLALPPIPPDLDGSLWSYIAGYAATGLLLLAFWERRAETAEFWAARSAASRRGLALCAAGGVLVGALALRAVAPETYLRFGDESGLFEPLTLGCYLAAALQLLATSGTLAEAPRKHQQLLAGGFALLSLEEVDYFGIFGGIFGKPGGVYAGALHDVIALATEGVLGPVAIALLGSGAAVVALALWRLGYLQPRALRLQFRAPEMGWLWLGGGLLFAAAALDAHWINGLGRPSLEEPLELAGAGMLLVYGFERVRRGTADAAPEIPAR